MKHFIGDITIDPEFEIFSQLDKYKILSFNIDMRPIPMQSARFTTKGGKMVSYQPAKITTAKKYIQNYIKSVISQEDINFPVKSILAIYVMFCFQQNKTEKLINSWCFRNKRPDLTDNLMKLLVDAMKGLIYEDDSQIVFVQTSKITTYKDCISVKLLINTEE